jgi:hypothetical protein
LRRRFFRSSFFATFRRDQCTKHLVTDQQHAAISTPFIYFKVLMLILFIQFLFLKENSIISTFNNSWNYNE